LTVAIQTAEGAFAPASGVPGTARRQWKLAKLQYGAMPGSNADLIKPIYEQWGRGNWRPRFEVYAPGMEWGWSDEFPGLAGVYDDRRDPNPRLRSWLSEWDNWRVEAEDYLEIGDQVVVLASYHGRGKGSGVEINQQGAHVFELRDGKVVRFEIFADRDRAIAFARAAEAEERDRGG
jgi:ketosteroid isomerase-like protein